ncbi:MAG: hypothetical protein FJ146_09385 [Deltaproteobacteria bacterium]|nr:hypothetical protein [Deltaproteobacteria bacterium]
MTRHGGGHSTVATGSGPHDELPESVKADRQSLRDLLSRLRELGIIVDIGQGRIKDFSLNVLLARTQPLWIFRLRRLEQCQDQAILKICKLLDESLKIAVLEDHKVAAKIASTQLLLSLRHGVMPFTSRALAYWGYFRIGGFLFVTAALRRAVQQATRLLSDHRFRSWQQPIVSEWMGFVLPWSFPRKLTPRRIEQLKYSIRSNLDVSLTHLASEYELAANMFATESLDVAVSCLRYLKETITVHADYASKSHDFGLAATIAKLSPGVSIVASPSGNVTTDPVGEQNGVINHFASSFKLSLAAVVAVVLRDYPTVIKTKAIIRSTTDSRNWPAILSPICFVLIVHASIAAVWSQKIGVKARLQLAREIALVFKLAYDRKVGFSWAKHLILGELGVAWGFKHFSYNQFRMARLKAKENGYLMPLAVIQERLAVHSLNCGDQELGRRQMKEARSIFAQWGSGLKLNQLDYQYSYLKLGRKKKRIVGKINAAEAKYPLSGPLNLRMITPRSSDTATKFHLRDLLQLLSPEMGASTLAKESLTNRVDNYLESIKQKSSEETVREISRQMNEKARKRAAEVPCGLFVASNYVQSAALSSDFILTGHDQLNQLFFFGLGDGCDRDRSMLMRSIELSGAFTGAISAAAEIQHCSTLERFKVVCGTINRMMSEDLSGDAAPFRLSLFVVEPKSGAGFYVNGGNHPAYVKRGADIKILGARGAAIDTAVLGWASSIWSFTLEQGDILFTHTNGLLGNQSGGAALFSRRKIRHAMLRASSAEELARECASMLKTGLSGNLQDDAAYLIISRLHL